MRELASSHGFAVHDFGYQLHGRSEQMEYHMVLRTFSTANLRRLAEALRSNPAVEEFRLARASD